MIIRLFVYGLLLRFVGSEPRACKKVSREINRVNNLPKCIDHLFGVCVKAANDINDLYDAATKRTMKDKLCASARDSAYYSNDTLAYLMIMEKYDHKADYYIGLIELPHLYIDRVVENFKAKEDHSEFMPLLCPNYTMKACRSLLTFCEHIKYAGLAYCTDPSFIRYKEYLQCYFSPSKDKANCRLICDKVLTKQLFGIEKTDDVFCKTGRDRCENIETAELIPECEGNFKEKCNVSDANTYSQCEEAIRSMKLSPQLLPSTLEDHKCNDPNSRLICMQYLKMLGERKMASQFVKTQCSKQRKPDICSVLEDYCQNSNLTLPSDPPECKPEEVATSTLAPHTQSYNISTTVMSTTHNRKSEKRISYVLLSVLLLLI